MLERGLPPWDFLLMTAVQVDRRTRLYKRLEEMGAVLQFVIERDRSGRISRESSRCLSASGCDKLERQSTPKPEK